MVVVNGKDMSWVADYQRWVRRGRVVVSHVRPPRADGPRQTVSQTAYYYWRDDDRNREWSYTVVLDAIQPILH